MDGEALIKTLPEVKGAYRPNYQLAKINWFNVGGPAEVLFRPEDAQDLAYFLKHKPADVPVTVIGVGSNLLVRDGGVAGVVIRLGRGFTEMQVDEDILTAGAACLDGNVALFAQQEGVGGLAFLSGVPGTIGGALRMNAGAYGTEMKDVLIEAEAIDGQGNIHTLSNEEMGFSYRHCNVPSDWIFTRAVFKGTKEAPKDIAERMKEITEKRETTQPIRERTSGSTFANPEGHKAWQLIDDAGLRGFQVGGAKISEKHCNFMINSENATAADLENLGEEVRRRVKEKSGIELRWEVQRIGEKTE
jgi:UDP-N-acetylmuramate dehydrogenase